MIEVLIQDGPDFIYVKCAGHANPPEHRTQQGDIVCAMATQMMQVLWANTGAPGTWAGPTGGMITLWVDDTQYMESLRFAFTGLDGLSKAFPAELSLKNLSTRLKTELPECPIPGMGEPSGGG